MKTLRALLARLRGLPRPSPRQWQGLGATLVTLAVLFWWAGEGPQEDPSAAPASGPAPEQVPDFSALPTVSARKAAFFAFLLPRIEAENQRIDELRARIEVLQSADGPWDGAAEAWLTDLETRYGLPSPEMGLIVCLACSAA